ncbi:hypothetical protein [Streptomyces sp900116325]|uniref:hypothetical protein n=1 Tax=unclassified Streptomyces TaxID=2593676 RepID=UPI0033ACDB56
MRSTSPSDEGVDGSGEVAADTAIDDLAHHTGRTPRQIIDRYQTDIIAGHEDLT